MGLVQKKGRSQLVLLRCTPGGGADGRDKRNNLYPLGNTLTGCSQKVRDGKRGEWFVRVGQLKEFKLVFTVKCQKADK